MLKIFELYFGFECKDKIVLSILTRVRAETLITEWKMYNKCGQKRHYFIIKPRPFTF